MAAGRVPGKPIQRIKGVVPKKITKGVGKGNRESKRGRKAKPTVEALPDQKALMNELATKGALEGLKFIHDLIVDKRAAAGLRLAASQYIINKVLADKKPEADPEDENTKFDGVEYVD